MANSTMQFPPEIWQEIYDHMEISDIHRMEMCGNKAHRRRVTSSSWRMTALNVENSRCPVEIVRRYLHFPLRTIRVIFAPGTVPGPTHAELVQNPSWLLSLPSTLETVHFSFPAAIAVWIRPALSTEVHWSFITANCVPIFIRDLLPNLRHLRLDGVWPAQNSFPLHFPKPVVKENCSRLFPELQRNRTSVIHHRHTNAHQSSSSDEESSDSESSSPPSSPSSSSTTSTSSTDSSSQSSSSSSSTEASSSSTSSLLRPRQFRDKIGFMGPSPDTILTSWSIHPPPLKMVCWPIAWCVSFLKTLPAGLETLDFGAAVVPKWFLPFMPRSLNTLLCAGVTPKPKQFPFPHPLDLEHQPFPHLQRLSGFGGEAEFLASLRKLTDLDLSASPLDALLKNALPPSLLRLTIRTSENLKRIVNLAGLPRSLTQLTVLDVLLDSKSPDAVRVLPQHLTDLTITSTHYGVEPHLAFSELSSLQHLVRFEYRDESLVAPLASNSSLVWIPASLTNLTLKSTHALLLESRSFKSETGHFDKLRALQLKGRIGAELANSSRPLCLPPNLTALDIESSKIDPFIFLQSPGAKGLKTLRLQECAKFNKAKNSQSVLEIPIQSRPPLLRNLRLPSDWLQASCSLQGSTHVSEADIKIQLQQRLHPDHNWLRNVPSSLLVQQVLSSHQLGSVTHLDLPTTHMTLLTLLDDLHHLVSLRVLSLTGTLQRGVRPQYPPLSRLCTLSGMPPGVLLSSQVLSNSLLELECDANHQEDLLKLKDLDCLTKLNTRASNAPGGKGGLLDYSQLPHSLNWIRMASLNESFFDREPLESRLTLDTSGIPLPSPPLAHPICLVHLEVSSMKLTESRLRSLAPHLTTLGVDGIIIEDYLRIIKELPRDILQITSLNWIQSICPSVTTFIPSRRRPRTTALGMPVFNNVSDHDLIRPYGVLDSYSSRTEELVNSIMMQSRAIETNQAYFSPDMDFALVEASSSDSSSWLPGLVEGIPLLRMAIDGLVSLPPTLTTLQTSDWVPVAGPFLPSTLTHLDVRSSPAFPDSNFYPFLPLPDTLTSFVMDNGCRHLPETFYAGLPRGLKTLYMRLVQGFPYDMTASTMPPKLENLCAPNCFLSSDTKIIFSRTSLIYLCVHSFEYASHLALLPPTLQHLELQADFTQQHLQSLPPTVNVTAWMFIPTTETQQGALDRL